MKKKFVAIITMMCMTLSISAVQVYSAADGENLALNKTVYSSGCYSANHPAQNAVDGNLKTIWAYGKQSADDGIEGYQIIVDLEETYNINEVYVRSRRDIDANWSRKGWKAYISTSKKISDGLLVGEKKVAGLFGEDLEIKIDKPVVGKYIIVQCESGTAISEIEAYGSDYHTEGFYIKNYTDAESDGIYLASYLDIVTGTTDSLFEPEMLVTRAEAAKYVISLIGAEPYQTDRFFEDVGQDNKYYSYIMTAASMGIVSRTENFYPQDYISPLDFYTMIFRVMGYGKAIEYHGGYPDGVIYMLSKIKLNDNVNVKLNERLNRKSAASAVYNALMACPYGINDEDDAYNYNSEKETMLNFIFNMDLKEGKVTANNATSLNTAEVHSSGFIMIGSKEYYDKSRSLYNYIGKNIMFLTDSEDNICAGWSKDNTVNVFLASELDNISQDRISYYNKDGRHISQRLDNAAVLRNYTAYTDYAYEKKYFTQDDSFIELTDNDGDGAAEIINIIQPTAVKVNNIVLDEEKLDITGYNGQSLKFEGYDNLVLTNDGKTFSKKLFTSSKLLLVYENETNKNIYIDSFSNETSGTVQSFDDDYVTIDGKKYMLTDFCKKNKSYMGNIEAGTKITVLADGEDRIFYIESDSAIKAGKNVGVITKLLADDTDETVSVRIFDNTGAFKTYAVSDSARIDGAKMTFEEMLSKREYFVGKFTIFGLNGSGQISYLETENSASPEEGLYKIEGTSKSCRRVGNGIFSGTGMLFPIRKNMPVFVLPYSEGNLLTGDSYERYYSISDMDSTFRYGTEILRSDDAFYCPDENGFPAFGVLAKDTISAGGKYGSTDSLSAPIIIVNSINNSVNADNEPAFSITGLDISSGAKFSGTSRSDLKSVIRTDLMFKDGEKSYMTNKRFIDNTLEIPQDYLMDTGNIRKGDILRLYTEDSVILGVEMIYSQTTEDLYTCSFGESPDTAYASVNIISGIMDNTSDGLIKYKTVTGAETRICDEFTLAIVFDSQKRAYSILPSAIPNYCKASDKIIALIKSGAENTLIIYSDN